MVDRAMAGLPRQLLDYLKRHKDDDVGIPKMSPSEWQLKLPSWYGRGKERGLKEWNSKTKRHKWSVGSLCALPLNKVIAVYMKILAVPPVVEGEMTEQGMMVKNDGINLFTSFLHCIHRCYCKFLNPEVEVGLEAYKLVLQYMSTYPVKLKLLGAVREDVYSRRFTNT